MNQVKHILLFLACFCFTRLLAQPCGPGTPSFTVNLVGQPNGTYTSPSIQRNDTCCGAQAPDVCIKFTILLDPSAVGINFTITSGAVPPGALFYQIACGPTVAVGTPVCLNGPGPHILTFCKPGNNQNQYSIISIPGPNVPDSVMVRNGCSTTLAVSGFSVPTINWNSINPGVPGAYNSYLSCTQGCATVTVTPTGTPPPFVDYEVSGFGASPCQGNFYKDTVRVYFYSNLAVVINPSMTTICFGQNNAVLTASASGGLAPYTYTWSNGSNSQSVMVGPGNYTVQIRDAITNCPGATATAVVNSFSMPITANAGPDQTLCKSSPNAALSGTIGMAGGGIWSGGSGTYNPSNTSLSMTYIPTPAEVSTGSVQLTLTSTGNQGCPGASDNVILFFQNAPVANAGPNATVCANNNAVALSGSITGFSSTPVWSSSGSGVFTSTSNLSTTYTPSNADNTAGTVTITLTTANNGVCPPATSTLQITITPAPVVNAGASQTICSTATAALNGSVTGGANSGMWLSSGNGTFTPSQNQLITNYVPGNSDILNGSVTLTLMSTNNGNCLAVTNTVLITIQQLAVVNAGPSQSVCSNSGTVALSGSVTAGSSTGMWTTNGSGAFNPGPNFLNNAYFLSNGDIGMGTLIFTLSSTNNGPCPAVTDTMMITIYQLAVVNAGPNQLLCENAGTIGLNGSVNTNFGVWTSSGNGNFLPNNVSLSASYSITASDANAGFVTFTLSSSNNGPCPVVSDSVRINIRKLAVVNAGNSQSICSNNGTVALNGSVSGGSSSGIWGTNGSGAFNPGPAALSNTYYVSVTDISMGSVIFTLTSTNNSPCPAIADTLIVTISQLAQVNAGPNQALCETSGSISLNGSVNTNSGVWATTGTGIFIPDNLSLTPIYSITAADINAGFVTFTLSSANNGPCPAVTDSVRISIRRLAVVNAGPDRQICNINTSVPLSGTVSGGSSSGAWFTTGSGNFSPSNTNLNTSYNISSGDINTATVSLVLTSQNNGVCPAVSDSVKLIIFKDVVIKMSSDTTICSYQNPLTLQPNISGDFGNIQWSTSGFGQFLPGINSLPAAYNITNDISLGQITLSITTVNSSPCGNKSATMKVTIRPSPKAAFAASAYTLHIPNDPVAFTNQSQQATTYFWSFGDGAFSSQTSPVHNYYAVGYYTVTLIAKNQYGCIDTVERDMLVISDIQFPNAFTPNVSGGNGGSYDKNDLSNNVFFPYTSGVTEYDLKIFNRWGELIFESHDLNIGWDGYFRDKLCQQDVYVWKANVKFFDGRSYSKTGSVTLLR